MFLEVSGDFWRYLEVSGGFWRFPDNPSLRDQTVLNYHNVHLSLNLVVGNLLSDSYFINMYC